MLDTIIRAGVCWSGGQSLVIVFFRFPEHLHACSVSVRAQIPLGAVKYHGEGRGSWPFLNSVIFLEKPGVASQTSQWPDSAAGSLTFVTGQDSAEAPPFLLGPFQVQVKFDFLDVEFHAKLPKEPEVKMSQLTWLLLTACWNKTSHYSCTVRYRMWFCL